MRRPRRGVRGEPPTALAFLDETGSIAHDRFFAVGCLKLSNPSPLFRQVQKERDRAHWYREIHWTDLTSDSVPFYRQIARVVASASCQFSCFVADRQVADPVKRFGNPWRAYQKLATQLLIGSIQPRELVTVLADAYSTPDSVRFEDDVKSEVNHRLGRVAVTAVCRLDSKAADPLQLVDLLTAAMAFEFRQNAGLAGQNTPKARLAAEIRQFFGVGSVLGGVQTGKLNIAIYRDQ